MSDLMTCSYSNGNMHVVCTAICLACKICTKVLHMSPLCISYVLGIYLYLRVPFIWAQVLSSAFIQINMVDVKNEWVTPIRM